MNTATTFDQTIQATLGSFEHPLLLQPVDMVPQDADDAVLDSWLAALDPREFELILSDLADDRFGQQFALEPTA